MPFEAVEDRNSRLQYDPSGWNRGHVYELCFPKGGIMASTETVSAVVFVFCGIVVAGGLVIHYAWPDKTKQALKPNKPRSSLGGVIRLLCIVIGLFVAIAVIDLIGLSIGAGTTGAKDPFHWQP